MNLDIYLTKILAPCQIVTTVQIVPKICQGQPQTFGSQCSRFHRYRFTFDGVIADCVKAVLWAHWVNPWFALSEASFRVNNNLRHTINYTVTDQLCVMTYNKYSMQQWQIRHTTNDQNDVRHVQLLWCPRLSHSVLCKLSYFLELLEVRLVPQMRTSQYQTCLPLHPLYSKSSTF